MVFVAEYFLFANLPVFLLKLLLVFHSYHIADRLPSGRYLMEWYCWAKWITIKCGWKIR